MPLYVRKAAAVISVSQITTDDFVATVPASQRQGANGLFRARSAFPTHDGSRSARGRQAQVRPARQFVLTLSKVGGDTRKNFAGVFGAFPRLHGSVPHKLVVGGKDCEHFRADYRCRRLDGDRTSSSPAGSTRPICRRVQPRGPVSLSVEPGSVSHTHTEAMACGTPIVTSRANGLEEIAGEAALLVDPGDHDAIAEAAIRALTDERLRGELSSAGLTRSTRYSWERCARRTLRSWKTSPPGARWAVPSQRPPDVFERPIRVVLFGGPYLHPAAVEFVVYLEQHPDIDLALVLCEGPGPGLRHRLTNLWRRRGRWHSW